MIEMMQNCDNLEVNYDEYSDCDDDCEDDDDDDELVEVNVVDYDDGDTNNGARILQLPPPPVVVDDVAGIDCDELLLEESTVSTTNTREQQQRMRSSMRQQQRRRRREAATLKQLQTGQQQLLHKRFIMIFGISFVWFVILGWSSVVILLPLFSSNLDGNFERCLQYYDDKDWGFISSWCNSTSELLAWELREKSDLVKKYYYGSRLAIGFFVPFLAACIYYLFHISNAKFYYYCRGIGGEGGSRRSSPPGHFRHRRQDEFVRFQRQRWIVISISLCLAISPLVTFYVTADDGLSWRFMERYVYAYTIVVSSVLGYIFFIITSILLNRVVAGSGSNSWSWSVSTLLNLTNCKRGRFYVHSTIIVTSILLILFFPILTIEFAFIGFYGVFVVVVVLILLAVPSLILFWVIKRSFNHDATENRKQHLDNDNDNNDGTINNESNGNSSRSRCNNVVVNNWKQSLYIITMTTISFILIIVTIILEVAEIGVSIFCYFFIILNLGNIYHCCYSLSLNIRYRFWILNKKEQVIRVCSQNGRMLRHAPEAFREDLDVVQVACKENGLALQYVCKELQSNAEIVTIACRQNGDALKYADISLRMNKEIVLVAVKSNPESLKYALDGLNQNRDCLIAAKLWDSDFDDDVTSSRHDTVAPTTDGGGGDTAAEKKIVLSTKFALGEECSSIATRFTVLLKQHPYIRENHFTIYSPNAFDKSTCDVKWTRKKWPCRGTFETCQMQNPALKTGIPISESCWRYSYRYQLEEAKRTDGIMIQLIELYFDDPLHLPDENTDLGDEEDGVGVVSNDNNSRYDDDDKDDDGIFIVANEEYAIGKGQSIESEMANEVGTKMFQVYQPRNFGKDEAFGGDLGVKNVDNVVSHIRAWYDNRGGSHCYADEQQQGQTLQSQQPRSALWCCPCQNRTDFGGSNPDTEFFLLSKDD